MSSNRSKEIHLANRPTGFPDDTNFIVKEVDLNDPNTDEVLVKNLWRRFASSSRLVRNLAFP